MYKLRRLASRRKLLIWPHIARTWALGKDLVPDEAGKGFSWVGQKRQWVTYMGGKGYYWWTETNQQSPGQERGAYCASNSILAECSRGKSFLINVHRPKGTLDNCYHRTVGSYNLSIRRDIIFFWFLLLLYNFLVKHCGLQVVEKMSALGNGQWRRKNIVSRVWVRLYHLPAK